MALAERGSGLASSGLAHQHGRDELGHGTHGFGFYKAGVHGFRFYRTSDLTRCENWPPDRISRSWLPLTVARATRGTPTTTGQSDQRDAPLGCVGPLRSRTTSDVSSEPTPHTIRVSHSDSVASDAAYLPAICAGDS